MVEKKVRMATVLAKIMGDVGRVEKKGKITSQGSGPSYKFARDSDVLEAVMPLMAEAGIVLVPEHTELLSIGPNMRETQQIANIKVRWHVTDGTESLRFETLGQGQDTGDKALPKAQSNARKYAFFMLYHIVTGDDPDQYASDTEQPGQGASPSRTARASSSETQRPVPAPAQYRRGELAALMAEKYLDNDAVLTYAAALGIPQAERPMSDKSMDILIEAIQRHGTADSMVTEQADAASSPDARTPSAVEPEAGETAPPAPAATTVEEAIAKAEKKAAGVA
jgi:hypothetical protein